MDKFFENMDNRFKSIENELKFKYDEQFWNDAENVLNDAELDNAFTKAAQQATVASNIDFNDIDNAFLDEAFVNAANQTQYAYNPSYWNDFTNVESNLYYNDAFVTAAAQSQAVYDANYWNDADLALQAEGLHHEYKPEYWKEAEKLLIKDSRNGFFFKWGVAATILLLISFLTFNLNNHHTNGGEVQIAKNNQEDAPSIFVAEQNNHQSSNTTIVNELNSSNENDNNTIGTTINNKINQPKHTNQLEEQNYNTQNQTEGFVKHHKDENSTDDVVTTKEQIEDNNDITQNQTTIDHLNNSIVNPDESIHHENESQFNQNELIENDNIFYEDKKIENIHLNNKDLKHISNDFSPKGIEGKQIDLTSFKLKPTHIFGIELSKGIGNNFNDDSQLSARNSLYLTYQFIPFATRVKNFSFGIDAGIYHQNLNNYEYESQYAVYHVEGNVDHYWYKMVYKDLVYLSARGNIYYSIANKHNLKLGFGVDKLATSRINMQYQKNKELKQNDDADQWGLNKGINSLDFSLSFGYEFKVNNNFSFTINAKHGILDKTNDELVKRTKNDIDKSILFGLKYTFFRKL